MNLKIIQFSSWNKIYFQKGDDRTMKLLSRRTRNRYNVLVFLLFINSLVFSLYLITGTRFFQNARQQPRKGRFTSSEYESRKQIYHKYYRPLEKQSINCSRLVTGDQRTIQDSYVQMKKFNSSTRNIKQDVFVTNCSYFRRSRGYTDHPLSDLELNFPLAFGMAVYKDIEQVIHNAVYIVKSLLCTLNC